jgi:ketol-acid reductoisomerase
VYEAKLILDMLIFYGPAGLTQKISPTAFYGGMEAGKRIIDSSRLEIMEKIFDDIRSGRFADRWMNEVSGGSPALGKRSREIQTSLLQCTYEKLKDCIRE